MRLQWSRYQHHSYLWVGAVFTESKTVSLGHNADIMQAAFSDASSWTKIIAFLFKFHGPLFRVYLSVIAVGLWVCLFCLFVCWQHYGTTHGLIFKKFSLYVELDTRNNLKNLGAGKFNLLHTGFPYMFLKEIRVCEQHYGKKHMNGFSWMFRTGQTWEQEQLEHFRDVSINLFNAGMIFLSFGSVFVGNIMKIKRLNGFSWHFPDMSDMTQGVII